MDEFGNAIASGGAGVGDPFTIGTPPASVVARATVGARLIGPDGAFITGSDVLMVGGATAAFRFGDLAPK